MSVTERLPRPRASRRLTRLEYAWIAIALLNYVAALVSQSWENLPFRVVWIGLAATYGLMVLHSDRLLKVVFLIGAGAGFLMLLDATHVIHLWSDPVDAPPVMALMCLVLVWNIARSQDDLHSAELLSKQQQRLLERQERFVQDASHELRTPLTIARGHLELLRSRAGRDHDLDVALDEMDRLDGIIERLLLLAASDQPDFLQFTDVDLEPMLDDVFVRWVDIAPRVWRLGSIPRGRIRIDPDRIRTALDSLLENAVKHTREHDAIELRAGLTWDGLLILEVADGGEGVPEEALGKIFQRFARADPARGRADGGVGLGLAIVDAIAKAHGGRCTVRSSPSGASFGLELPGFVPEHPMMNVAGETLNPAAPAQPGPEAPVRPAPHTVPVEPTV